MAVLPATASALTIDDLGPTSSTTAGVGWSAVNDSDQVSGYSQVGPNEYQATRWVNGTSSLLGTAGTYGSAGYAITNAGTVLGYRGDDLGLGLAIYPTLWDAAGNQQELAAYPGGEAGGFIAAANNGTAVFEGDESATSVNTSRYVIAAPPYTSITTTPGFDATGVNNSGHAIGSIESPPAPGFWNGSAASVLQVKPNGARGLNNLDLVTGNTVASGQAAVEQEPAGTVAILPELPGAPSGDFKPQAINDSSVVVGNAASGAAIWTPGGTTQPLDTLLPPGSGWHLVTAVDINAGGDVLGTGTLNGQTRWYLLQAPGCSVSFSGSTRRARAATAPCGGISLSPNSNARFGATVTVSGTGWDGTKGDVALALLDPVTGQHVGLLASGVPSGPSGTFTTTFTLDKFTRRALYPNVKTGCAVDVTAQQGKHAATATATSPGVGHVAYARYGKGSAPFKTGDVYCLGESPTDSAGVADVVVTTPASGSAPAANLTAYRIAADPLSINLRGSGGPQLYVGGTLCLGSGSKNREIVISASNPLGHVGTCPVSFPARGVGNAAVRRLGLAAHGLPQNGCLELAANGGLSTPQNPRTGSAAPLGPLAFVGDIDCKLDPFVGPAISFSRPVFVDGSLRVRSPYVNVLSPGELITAGSLVASAGIASAFSGARVIVGRDASFGLGPPGRGMSQAQKVELGLLAQQYTDTGSIATHSGTIIGPIGGILALSSPPSAAVAVGSVVVGGLLSATSSWGDIMSRITTAIATDPPDRAYRTVARAAAAGGSLPVIRSGKGLSKAKARVLNALVSAMAREAVVARALETAVNRAGGASRAGSTVAEGRQVKAAVKYALSSARLLATLPAHFKAAARVLGSLPAGRYRPTAKNFAAFRRVLRHRGFSARYAAQERRIGITGPQLKLLRLVMLASPDPQRRTAAEIIGDPKFARAVRLEAKLFRAFAKSAPSTVGRQH